MKALVSMIGAATLVASAALAQTPAPIHPPQTKDDATLKAWIASTIQLKAQGADWTILDSSDDGVRLAQPSVSTDDEDIRTIDLRIEHFAPVAGDKGPVLSEYAQIAFNCHRNTRTELAHQTYAEHNLKGARRSAAKLDKGVMNLAAWNDLATSVCKSKVVKQTGAAG